MPSRIKFPLCGVNSESKTFAAVVFPLPVGPTNATRDPGMFSDTLSSAFLVASGYL